MDTIPEPNSRRGRRGEAAAAGRRDPGSSRGRTDARGAASLLALVAPIRAPGRRLDRLSALFVGSPYVVGPLVGSPTLRERFVARLDAFDCVTLVESVYALAASRLPEEFTPRLKALRYDDGRVSWRRRNHYMSDWIERNHAAGLVTRVAPALWAEEAAPRRLSTLAGYPPVEKTLAYVPVSRLDQLLPKIRTGDLICFVSERPDLDAFHVGLLVSGRPVKLRHAARSAGRVVEEELPAFLGRNTTRGFMVARLKAARQERK